jgi:hypothetical protein
LSKPKLIRSQARPISLGIFYDLAVRFRRVPTGNLQVLSIACGSVSLKNARQSLDEASRLAKKKRGGT